MCVCVAAAVAMNDVLQDLRQLATELLSRDSDSNDDAGDEHVTTWQLTAATDVERFSIPVIAEQPDLNPAKEAERSALGALHLWLELAHTS